MFFRMVMKNNPAKFRFPTLQSGRKSSKPKGSGSCWNQLVINLDLHKLYTIYTTITGILSVHLHRLCKEEKCTGVPSNRRVPGYSRVPGYP